MCLAFHLLSFPSYMSFCSLLSSVYRDLSCWIRSHWDTAIMVSIVSIGSSLSYLLDRASVTTLSLSYRYSTMKSYPKSLVSHLCCMGVLIFWSSRNFRLLWLVLTVNFDPNRYGLHLCTAHTKANNSFSYVESVNSFPFKARLKKDIGCPSCRNIASMALLKASHSIWKGWVKLRSANTWGFEMARLSLVKASPVSGLQENPSFFNKAFNGLAIPP